MFVSELAGYPGFIRLPHPFLGKHYKQWLKAGNVADLLDQAQPHSRKQKRAKQKNNPDNWGYFMDWQAALAIIEEWAIDGLPEEDLDKNGDNVPTEVISWVNEVVSEYVVPLTNLKNLRRASGIT